MGEAEDTVEERRMDNMDKDIEDTAKVEGSLEGDLHWCLWRVFL